MFGRHFSPYSGSASIFFCENLLIQGEDSLLKNGSKMRWAVKVCERFAELYFFRDVVNKLAVTTQHECFGHGYRLRDLGTPAKKYVVNPGFESTL